jgi:hypothetical protein
VAFFRGFFLGTAFFLLCFFLVLFLVAIRGVYHHSGGAGSYGAFQAKYRVKQTELRDE